jgi:hypothetical protein
MLARRSEVIAHNLQIWCGEDEAHAQRPYEYTHGKLYLDDACVRASGIIHIPPRYDMPCLEALWHVLVIRSGEASHEAKFILVASNVSRKLFMSKRPPRIMLATLRSAQRTPALS